MLLINKQGCEFSFKALTDNTVKKRVVFPNQNITEHVISNKQAEDLISGLLSKDTFHIKFEY